MSAGIDYGNGLTNVDHETGIRYGVIHSHEVGQAWYDSSETNYGEPHCPECGNEAVDADKATDVSPEGWDNYSKHGCADYACNGCEHYLDSADVTPDEPISHTYDDDGYQAEQGDHDIFITKAPYYTYAPFCSPCAPGAGYLGSAIPTDITDEVMFSQYGVKTYCFGHDWFEDGKAPYLVFRVADDTEVVPESDDTLNLPDNTRQGAEEGE